MSTYKTRVVEMLFTHTAFRYNILTHTVNIIFKIFTRRHRNTDYRFLTREHLSQPTNYLKTKQKKNGCESFIHFAIHSFNHCEIEVKR